MNGTKRMDVGGNRVHYQSFYKSFSPYSKSILAPMNKHATVEYVHMIYLFDLSLTEYPRSARYFGMLPRPV